MALAEPLPLIPIPASVVREEGALALTATSRIIADGVDPSPLQAGIAARTGIRPPVGDGDARPGDVVLRCGDGESESYRLSVSDRVVLDGGDAAGLFYGTQTLLQLLTKRADANGWEWPCAEIADAPRFGYRGVMLDVVRRFFPVDEVRTIIDRIAALKFNHLHLHLSDDQGWRLHIDSWPLLSQRASSSSVGGAAGGCYSRDDYREIVAHAAARHVTIVPEIDLPGHTHAVGVAYPDLVEDPVITDGIRADAKRLDQALPETGVAYTGWAVGHSSLRIGRPRTAAFVRDVLTEVAALTPGPYLHIGGDEALGTGASDYAAFVAEVTAVVQTLGKTPIAWHEAGAVDEIASGTIGQFWGTLTPSPQQAAQAAHLVDRGGRLILSPADAAYLDMKPEHDFPLGLDWAGVVDVRRAHDWDPHDVLDLPDEAIAGIEAPLWTETVRSLDDAERLLFPRCAAIAEVAWSPPDGPERGWESFRMRLGRSAPLWHSDGIRFHPAPEIPWSTP